MKNSKQPTDCVLSDRTGFNPRHNLNNSLELNKNKTITSYEFMKSETSTIEINNSTIVHMKGGQSIESKGSYYTPNI